MSLAQRSLVFNDSENVPKKKSTAEPRRKLGVIQPKASQARLILGEKGLMLHSPTRGKKRKNDENNQPGKSKRSDGIFEDPIQPPKKQRTFASIAVQTDHSGPVKVIVPRVITGSISDKTESPAKAIDSTKTDSPAETSPSSSPAAGPSVADTCTSPTAPAASADEEASSKAKDNAVSNVLDMLTSDTAPPEYWEGVAEKRREALETTLQENQELHQENQGLKEEVKVLKEENKLLEEMVEEARGLAEMVQSLTAEAENEESSE